MNDFVESESVKELAIIEPAEYAEAFLEVSVPASGGDLKALEDGLITIWGEAVDLAYKLQGKFQEAGSYLSAIRCSGSDIAPFRESGYATWKDYCESVLTPLLGITYERACQIADAYEQHIAIIDTLRDIERSAMAQRIADQLNATMPKNLPTNEAPYRALAGLNPETSTAVLGMAQQIGGSDNPTFNTVRKARKIHEAVEKGVITLDASGALTKKEVEDVLLYDQILADCRRIPILMLHQLEVEIADMIVERTQNESEEINTGRTQ